MEHIKLVRNGSRGMLGWSPWWKWKRRWAHCLWPGQRRIHCRLFDALIANGDDASAPCLGPTDEIPYLKKQDPPDLRTLRHRRPAFTCRLRQGPRWLQGPRQSRSSQWCRRRWSNRDQLRPARTWRRGFSNRDQMENRSQNPSRSEIHRLQRGRRRQRYVRRPHDHGRRSVRVDRRHDNRRHRDRRDQRLHLLSARNIRLHSVVNAPLPGDEDAATSGTNVAGSGNAFDSE